MTDRFDEMTKAIYYGCLKHYGDIGTCSDCVAAALRRVHAEAIEAAAKEAENEDLDPDWNAAIADRIRAKLLLPKDRTR